jgi:hypothetical protein
MDHFAGLDVLVKETSICIVDDAGRSFGKSFTSFQARSRHDRFTPMNGHIHR